MFLFCQILVRRPRYAAAMVWSSQPTMGMARHRALRQCRCVLEKSGWRGGKRGWTVRFRPSTGICLSRMSGDTETGGVATRLTLPPWKFGTGRKQLCNVFPSGGCQQVGNGLSRNSVIRRDGPETTGAAVLQGATPADRRRAQARQVGQQALLGVRGPRAAGAGGQDPRDTVGPPRGVDAGCAGNLRIRDVRGGKGRACAADCRAMHTAGAGRATPPHMRAERAANVGGSAQHQAAATPGGAVRERR